MRHGLRLSAALVAVGAAAACDLPTEAPIIEQRWVLPVEETTIGIADLLPASVEDRGDAFRVTLDGAVTSTTLGAACGGCAAANGSTVPKPAFSTTLAVSEALPDRVTAVELAGAQIPLVIQNGFGFDPIRPGGAPGSMTIVVRSGATGPVLGQIALDGATTSIPAGGTVTRTLTLTGTVTGSIRIEVALESPAGDPVTINTAQTFTVRTQSTVVDVPAVSATVAGESLTIDPVELDTEDIESDITERIVEGGIRLEVENPFGVVVDGTILIDFPGGRIGKSLTIPGGSSTQTVSYTGDELRSFIGVDGSVLTGTFTVADDPGVATLRAGQTLEIKSLIDLTIRIGG